MKPETIGLISGLLVTISVVPYAVRTYQRKIQPNLVSWTIWTVLALALLLTYRSAGATSNVWPAVFGFTNPLLISLLIFWRGKRNRPNRLEVVFIIVGIAAIVLWWFLRESKSLAKYALYVAILADACAAIPTIVSVWKNPDEDRPFAWLMFAVGYGLSLFAIEDNTFSNYLLPIYMTVGSASITIPLIRHRWRNKTPLKEWW